MNSISLSWMDNWDYKTTGPKPELLEIHSLLIKVQELFPNMFISSNRAEQFNSVHDRDVNYNGRRDIDSANNHMKSWILFKYHEKGVKHFMLRSKFILPMTFIKNTAHLSIDGLIFNYTPKG